MSECRPVTVRECIEGSKEMDETAKRLRRMGMHAQAESLEKGSAKLLGSMSEARLHE